MKHYHLRHTDGNKIIIHVSGPSGSGKTTLGNKLISRFGNKIVVKDVDGLRNEFIKEFYGEKEWSVIDKDVYQKYISNFVKDTTKPLIFVGLNTMPWWHKSFYYDMHSNNNFYIKIDDTVVLTQKCTRFFKDIVNDKRAMEDLVRNNEKFIKKVQEAISIHCDLKNIVEENKELEKDYREQKYIFLDRDEIYQEICKLLE